MKQTEMNRISLPEIVAGKTGTIILKEI